MTTFVVEHKKVKSKLETKRSCSFVGSRALRYDPLTTHMQKDKIYLALANINSV